MSGGIAQLVAIGAQDAHIVGKPEVSFFRSNYKRHTNFAQTVEKQVIQGNPTANGMSTVRFERKGDLVGYVYITNRVAGTALTRANWEKQIAKVDLLVGGQVIDTQTSEFSQEIAPVMLAQTYSKSLAAAGGNDSRFYPLRFSFCENAQSALPLVALQYHDVELRITWGTGVGGGANAIASDYEVHTQFIYLDTDERTTLANTPQNMLITQTQKMVKSGSPTQELSFNHPVKFLATYDSTGVGVAGGNVKLQINGTDVGDAKHSVNYTSTALYHHTPFSTLNSSVDTHLLYPFCLDTSKLQPTGSLNFSRIDSARLLSDSGNFNTDIYAVNYNILRIENGMAGLLYSN
jgi:hypothetical protein